MKYQNRYDISFPKGRQFLRDQPKTEVIATARLLGTKNSECPIVILKRTDVTILEYVEALEYEIERASNCGDFFKNGPRGGIEVGADLKAVIASKKGAVKP